jgi:hypothetical protein
VNPTSAPKQIGHCAFVAFTRVVEPHAEAESEKVRFPGHLT